MSSENVEFVRRHYEAWETLVLRVQEGLDQEAIARRLGTSESDVSSSLEGAFERLRGLAPREVSR